MFSRAKLFFCQLELLLLLLLLMLLLFFCRSQCRRRLVSIVKRDSLFNRLSSVCKFQISNLKWLILHPNETLSYPTEFFIHLPSESVWTVGVRWYADVITKFSRTHRFPQFSLGLRFRSDGPLFIFDPSAYASDSARKLWEILRRRSQYLFILFGSHSACSSI